MIDAQVEWRNATRHAWLELRTSRSKQTQAWISTTPRLYQTPTNANADSETNDPGAITELVIQLKTMIADIAAAWRERENRRQRGFPISRAAVGSLSWAKDLALRRQLELDGGPEDWAVDEAMKNGELDDFHLEVAQYDMSEDESDFSLARSDSA